MSENAIEHYQENGTVKKSQVNNTSIEYKQFKPQDEDREITLLGVTGGPGLPKEHLAPLSLLSKKGYSVVLYDQHNVGNSGDSDNPYEIETFRRELKQLIEQFENVVLIGHSWGSMLSLDYAVDHDNIDGVVAVAPLFDTQKNIEIAQTIRAEELTVDELEEMLDLEDAEDYDNERYRELEEKLDDSRGFKPPVPDFAAEQFERMNIEMYENMWGPIEYHLNNDAALKNWSVMSSLDQISVPVLLTTGKDDSFGIHDLYQAANKIEVSCDVEIITEASHTPPWETTEQFIETVNNWLQKEI